MKVVIYGAPGCGFCTQAKKICESNKYDYTYIDMQLENISQSELESRIGSPIRSIPQILINDQYVGGYLEFVSYLRENA